MRSSITLSLVGLFVIGCAAKANVGPNDPSSSTTTSTTTNNTTTTTTTPSSPTGTSGSALSTPGATTTPTTPKADDPKTDKPGVGNERKAEGLQPGNVPDGPKKDPPGKAEPKKDPPGKSDPPGVGNQRRVEGTQPGQVGGGAVAAGKKDEKKK
jgi:hypothetical protein